MLSNNVVYEVLDVSPELKAAKNYLKGELI